MYPFNLFGMSRDEVDASQILSAVIWIPRDRLIGLPAIFLEVRSQDDSCSSVAIPRLIVSSGQLFVAVSSCVPISFLSFHARLS